MIRKPFTEEDLANIMQRTTGLCWRPMESARMLSARWRWAPAGALGACKRWSSLRWRHAHTWRTQQRIDRRWSHRTHL